MKNNDKNFYIYSLNIIDYIKNKFEKDENYFVFGEVELEIIDDEEKEPVNERCFSLSINGYYNDANRCINHLQFNRTFMDYGFLFEQSKIYKHLPYKFLVGFIEVLIYINEIVLAYDLASFVYTYIVSNYSQEEKEAKEILVLINDIESLCKKIIQDKNTSSLEEYVKNKVIKKEQLLYKSDEFIINQMNDISKIVDMYDYIGLNGPKINI